MGYAATAKLYETLLLTTISQMFNATSVNEATRSTSLNHYILVFTIVTIFYLPLSFTVVSITVLLHATSFLNNQCKHEVTICIAII